MTTALSVDPRVRRTRRLLEEAVLELVAEGDPGLITIRTITDRAEVNRATFYLHYRDKDDLIARALDTLFEEFTNEELEFAKEHGRLLRDVVPPPLIDLFHHVEARRALYRSLLDEAGSNVFATRLRTFHEQQFLLIWKDLGLEALTGSPPAAVRAHVAATTVQSVIGWWLATGSEETAETMANWLWDIVNPMWFTSVATTARWS